MNKISIVIPTYNEEGYIGQLLASIARQTVKPHEVIIVDSFSKDQTHKIISKFINKLPITCVCSPRGIGLARNIGADAATGDILLFLDSDVELQSNFLEDSVKEFNERGLDLASSHFYVDQKTPKLDQIGAKAFSLYHASFQYSKNPMGSGFCIFATKNWHNKVKGFNVNFRHSEDHDYVRRAVTQGAKFRLLKSVRFKLSNRRYVHDGRFTVLSLYTKAEINRIFFNYRFAPREEALYHFGIFSKNNKNKRRSAQIS